MTDHITHHVTLLNSCTLQLHAIEQLLTAADDLHAVQADCLAELIARIAECLAELIQSLTSA